MQQSQTVDPAVQQRQQSNTTVGISILSSVVEGRSYVHCTVDIKKKGSQDRSLIITLFQTSKPASLAVTGGEGEAFIPVKLQDHSDHMLIREMSQQLTIEAAVLDIALSRCQDDNRTPAIFLFSKESQNVLCEQNGLAYG